METKKIGQIYFLPFSCGQYVFREYISHCISVPPIMNDIKNLREDRDLLLIRNLYK